MNRRVAHFYFLLALAFAMTAACSQVTEEAPISEQSAEKVEKPDQESWGSTIIITREGRRFAMVWAGYIAVFNKENLTKLSDSIHVDFYNREGLHNSVLTALRGEVDNNTENLKAMGNVVVVSDSGIILETETLLWDNEGQKIISNLPVKFTTQTDTLIGDSFVSNPALTDYELRNARGYSRRTLKLDKKTR